MLAIFFATVQYRRHNCRQGRLFVYFNIFRNIRSVGVVLLFFSFLFHPSLPPLSLSLYSIDLRIYFSIADLDRMSRMFSLVLSPKFYRGRTSIVISQFGIHFPILPLASSSVTYHLPSFLPPPLFLSLFLFHVLSISLSFHSFHFMRFYPWFCLSYRSDSTHSRAVSYSQPPWQ